MTSRRDDLLTLDKAAIARIMAVQSYGRNSLAKALKRSPSEVGLWINGKRRITVQNAHDLSTVLGCTIENLTGQKPFIPIDITNTKAPLGTPEYYMNAIIGKWIATSTIFSRADLRGEPVPENVFQFDVEFYMVNGRLLGTCHCTTPFHEQAEYALKVVEVTGRGFIMLDGIRATDDGAEDVFRSIEQYYSDTRTQNMDGGFVMYWPVHREIFVGRHQLRKIT